MNMYVKDEHGFGPLNLSVCSGVQYTQYTESEIHLHYLVEIKKKIYPHYLGEIDEVSRN